MHRRFLRLCLFVLLSSTGVALVVAGARGAEEFTVGKPWTGERAVRQRTSEIAQRESRATTHGRRVFRVHPNPHFEVVEYEADAFPPVAPQDAGPQAASGSTAQTVSTTFLGATLADCQAYPPDTMGAVGPQQFIVAVNGRIRSFNKFTGAADGAVNANTDVFFAPVMTPPVNNNFTSDPRIRYDRLTQRWFIIMIDVPGQAGALPDRIMIAVSDGPVITAGTVWSLYQFQHDQPSGGGDTGNLPITRRSAWTRTRSTSA